MRVGNRARETRRLRQVIHPLRGVRSDYDELLEFIGDARIVLIGVSSHGTHEFYRERATITRRLIAEKGFIAVAADADWPDAHRVNAYVRHVGAAKDADGALDGFRRFPSWVWRNTEVLKFVEWLHRFNAGLARPERVGFYGLDLYRLYASIESALSYLDRADPEAATRARYRFSSLDHLREDSQAHGFAPSFGLPRSTEDEAVEQLRDLQRNGLDFAQSGGRIAEDDDFYAALTASMARNAERYFRAMFGGRVSAWNLRNRHVADMLQQLIGHLDRTAPGARVVVWDHTAHVGDARATDVSRSGEINLGQLVRDRWGTDVVNVGLLTHHGAVTTAAQWEAPIEQKAIPPALHGSYEEVFHSMETPSFMLFTPKGEAVLPARRLERAIGLIYRPETERLCHYFEASLAGQFDAVLHFDETRAVEPLDRTPEWERGPSAAPPADAP